MSNTTTQVRQTQDFTNNERSTLTYTPRFDIWEDETAFHLTGDLPGVSSEHLEIQYKDGELQIWGKAPPRQDEVEYWAQEYGIGDYYRSFSLDKGIDGDRIDAVLKDGVLELTLPKHPSVLPRRIAVKSG
ncbi:Hsp20/alpha crystallin family protein [Anatilimnocola floriformis]|uniref:Hsp20/alpha crystallin family protein n=1 Tax=Anatilimnocola floriformis TaxID=2948575 RepID=UPI0020C5862C|nr:Hsp20/alpha crystallin family protein [Anatilimnocola floriformis]